MELLFFGVEIAGHPIRPLVRSPSHQCAVDENGKRVELRIRTQRELQMEALLSKAAAPAAGRQAPTAP